MIKFFSFHVHSFQFIYPINYRHSDFLSGLPVTPLPEGVTIGPLSPADRIRLVYSYITSMPSDGGLGITPDSPDWDCVESIFPLHDREFNEAWRRAWKPKQLVHVAVGKVRQEVSEGFFFFPRSSATQWDTTTPSYPHTPTSSSSRPFLVSLPISSSSLTHQLTPS